MNRAGDRSRTIFAGAIPLVFDLVDRLRFTLRCRRRLTVNGRAGCGIDLDKTGHYGKNVMRTPVRFCCGVLLTTALTGFQPPDRSLGRACHYHHHGDHHYHTGVPGSLDQAILQGNADSPPVTINFAIPPFNGTVQTIVLQSNLPAITSPLAINGFSQSGSPGAFPGTLTNNPVLLIALGWKRRSAPWTATGLTFTVAGSVQGLTIQNFKRCRRVHDERCHGLGERD